MHVFFQAHEGCQDELDLANVRQVRARLGHNVELPVAVAPRGR